MLKLWHVSFCNYNLCRFACLKTIFYSCNIFTLYSVILGKQYRLRFTENFYWKNKNKLVTKEI